MRVLALLIALMAFAGCGGSAEADPRPIVVAGFYPLAWAAERMAGPGMRIVNMTSAGVEPHDLELSPRDVATIRDADLVVYVGGGFQPALEDAVGDRDGPSVDLLDGESDPHVWLDPPAFAASVVRLARAIRGERAAGKLVIELERLDGEYRQGLRRCERRTLVTTHAAFGRLARRYGLTELSLAGRSPEAEPGPRELEELVAKVRESEATTVFAEPLVSGEIPETVAREAGIQVETLDPIEGLSEEQLAAGEDYLSVMRSNLVVLREALGCH